MPRGSTPPDAAARFIIPAVPCIFAGGVYASLEIRQFLAVLVLLPCRRIFVGAFGIGVAERGGGACNFAYGF